MLACGCTGGEGEVHDLVNLSSRQWQVDDYIYLAMEPMYLVLCNFLLY